MNKVLKPFLARAKKSYELKELERLGLSPSLEQRELILTYFCLLLKWNDIASLVSKNDEQHIFLRHFCDSLQPLLLFGFKKNANILDIGSGGGFPSIPIRIFRPDLTFVLADSNKKKCEYLNEVKKELVLDNIEIYNGRVEKMKCMEKKFDYVVARGLGTMQLFSELARPFLSHDGVLGLLCHVRPARRPSFHGRQPRSCSPFERVTYRTFINQNERNFSAY